MDSTVTFQEVAVLWLKHIKSTVAPSTYLEYHRVTEVHILPALGNYTPSAVDSALLEKFMSDLSGAPSDPGRHPSPTTVKHIFTILRQILHFAAAEGFMPEVNTRAPRFRTPPSAGRCFQSSDIPVLTAFAEKGGIREYGILLCLDMGLRIGELCALQWADVDLENGILHVRKTVKRVENEQPGAQRCLMVIGEPKTRTSYRDIPIPDEIWARLRTFRSEAGSDACYVLNGRSDRFVLPRSYEHSFATWLEKCGIPAINVHSLRHSFATRCLQYGCGLKPLSEMLGHSSVSTTLNLYIHSNMDEKRDAINTLTGKKNGIRRKTYRKK
ncbi:MAG: site-specific integrase [Lachnospiraceae bacterium]|jgi:integrase|nr:site-specific integrase [Lachnospiraceae bacterium]